MDYLGKYFGREVYWLNFEDYTNDLPEKNWVCLGISNVSLSLIIFEAFVRKAIENNILEFKGYGKFGEKLYDWFDEIIVQMKVLENRQEFDVMTTCHNNQTLASALWECFFATTLPETADLNDIKIVCVDLDAVVRVDEFKLYLNEFELGWIPQSNVKHEVWEDPEGLTTLCLADDRGNDCINLLEPNSKLIYSFYAESHYEAMTIYYKFMEWGVYMTEFEIDKVPYEKLTTKN